MRAARPTCVRVMHEPQIDADVLVVARASEGNRLVGRQVAGRGRVVPRDEAFEPGIGRYIEIYSSTTDIGRARLKRLGAPLREFLELQLSDHPDVDVTDVDEVPLDVDGYI
ncbi:MAG: hypothetical protein V2J24_00095 [Pseudomonadales bacterium]|nr:hypothetical protein [Pseudomonadales bacterium]